MNTPKTIEELKSWYIARGLPPEETTRFFIGKDVREPRAFGIYYDGFEFVVYKNKANGIRAIRYQGPDEAFAVNELYQRLKDEIQHQKNRNQERRNTNHRNAGRRHTAHSVDFNKIFGISVICIFTFALLFPIINLFGSFIKLTQTAPVHDYYYSDTGILYYRTNNNADHKNMDWWLYDTQTHEWSLYQENTSARYFPEDMTRRHVRNDIVLLAEEMDEDYHNINIRNSHNFIDAGHHSRPTSSYYYYDDQLYYFLNDLHGTITNNTGWYVYEDDEWIYYCDEYDKDALGDDLWYSESQYYVGNDIENIYEYDDNIPSYWSPADFEETYWYHEYEQNEQHYQEQNNNRWDNDNGWDWDGNDDWDNWDTNWDDDW